MSPLNKDLSDHLHTARQGYTCRCKAIQKRSNDLLPERPIAWMIGVVWSLKINNEILGSFHMRQGVGEAGGPRLFPGYTLDARDTAAAPAADEGGTNWLSPTCLGLFRIWTVICIAASWAWVVADLVFYLKG